MVVASSNRPQTHHFRPPKCEAGAALMLSVPCDGRQNQKSGGRFSLPPRSGKVAPLGFAQRPNMHSLQSFSNQSCKKDTVSNSERGSNSALNINPVVLHTRRVRLRRAGLARIATI